MHLSTPSTTIFLISPKMPTTPSVALNPDTCASQVEAVDAILRLFYDEQREEESAVFSRTAEQKTLMMHYVLVVALTVENFTMDSAQVRTCPLIEN